MRSWRSELLSLALVLAMPVMVVVVFPYPALKFRARTPEAAPVGFAAYVTLTAVEEDEAIKAAKTSWRGEDEDSPSRSELLLGELPAPDSSPVLTIESRNRPVFHRRSDAHFPVYQPSQAAAFPEQLVDDGAEVVKPAFSRQELLEIH